MSQQNIYDNNTFFEGYQKLRKNQNNANNVFEGPALFSLLPDLKDKTVLDLGCGVGGHCFEFVNGGAKKVVGIDISKKMLEVAQKENHHQKITYLNLPMENLSSLNERFDLVVSSLAIHYVKDFEKLASDVFNLLNENGLFSNKFSIPIISLISFALILFSFNKFLAIISNILLFNLQFLNKI